MVVDKKVRVELVHGYLWKESSDAVVAFSEEKENEEIENLVIFELPEVINVMEMQAYFETLLGQLV